MTKQKVEHKTIQFRRKSIDSYLSREIADAEEYLQTIGCNSKIWQSLVLEINGIFVTAKPLKEIKLTIDELDYLKTKKDRFEAYHDAFNAAQIAKLAHEIKNCTDPSTASIYSMHLGKLIRSYEIRNKTDHIYRRRAAKGGKRNSGKMRTTKKIIFRMMEKLKSEGTETTASNVYKALKNIECVNDLIERRDDPILIYGFEYDKEKDVFFYQTKDGREKKFRKKTIKNVVPQLLKK